MRASFVLLTLIVLAAGCVNPFGDVVGGSGGPGVVINSLSFAPSNLKSNQLTKLSLAIENKGDYPIETDSGTIYLFNLPNDWELTDKGDATTPEVQFSLLNPQKRGFKSYSGETTNFEWVLRAPKELPKDEIFSYDAQVRVCYPYTTKVWGRLEVVSENAWLQKPPAEHAIDVQQTNGPIKVEFVSKQPLMVEADVKIKIRVTNVGDGVVTTNECSIFSTVSDDGTAISNLNRISLGTSDCTLADDLYLEKGKTKETYITCTPPALGDNPITTSDFTMELTYNYYSDKKASVRVTGLSEDASGGMIGVGRGTITLSDMATKLCDANGQKTSTFAMGMCRPESESSALDYPLGNTFGFQVMLEPLGVNELGKGTTGVVPSELKTIVGTAYDTATIKDLKLHDARMGDFSGAATTTRSDGTLIVNGLLDWKISDLDSGTFTKQYDAKKLDVDTDMDGLPDWFEEKYASGIISATSKDTNKNGLPDPSETYKGTQTYLALYTVEKATHVSSLGIADYICKNYAIGQPVGSGVTMAARPCTNMAAISGIKLADLASISVNGVEYKPLTNSADLEKLRNLPIDASTITAIDGFSISTMRSSISGINIGDVYVSKIPATTNLQNFLKYSKCSGSATTYSRDVVAKCVMDTSPKKLTWVQSSANTQCDMTCKNTIKLTGGACTTKTYATSPICKGSSVVEIRSFSNVAMGCTAPETCVCFGNSLATLAPSDIPLVCGV